jgi:hypothetical protein
VLVAVLLGGGALFASEAGVTAILMTTLPPSSAPIFPTRPVEAVIGGAVALAVSSLAFPPNPGLLIGRATDRLLAELTLALETMAAALDERDERRALSALEAARALDGKVVELQEALDIARETVRLSPLRRGAGRELERYAGAAGHIDLAVRNSRVLARHGVRAIRAGSPGQGVLSEAIRELKRALWALSSELDDPARPSPLETHVARASVLSTCAYERNPSLAIAEVVAQIRSVSIDLLRASRGAASAQSAPAHRAAAIIHDPATEELLALPTAVDVAA